MDNYFLQKLAVSIPPKNIVRYTPGTIRSRREASIDGFLDGTIPVTFKVERNEQPMEMVPGVSDGDMPVIFIVAYPSNFTDVRYTMVLQESELKMSKVIAAIQDPMNEWRTWIDYGDYEDEPTYPGESRQAYAQIRDYRKSLQHETREIARQLSRGENVKAKDMRKAVGRVLARREWDRNSEYALAQLA